MQRASNFPGISGSTLKLIAIITMFIDHAGATVLRSISRQLSVVSVPERKAFWMQMYSTSRSIGRIAFPIFCFLLVEGFLHTRNVKKYASRLFLFALLSELPFDLALKGNWYYPEKQNVYFTLLIGLLVLVGFRWIAQFPWGPEGSVGADGTPGSVRSVDTDGTPGSARLVDADTTSGSSRSTGRLHHRAGNTAVRVLRHLLFIPILLAGMALALRMDTDYNYKGVCLIAVLYLTHRERLFQCAGGALSVAWELPAPAAFLPVFLYNGKRGLKMKYFFYWFYPVHLLLLHALAKYAVPALF